MRYIIHVFYCCAFLSVFMISSCGQQMSKGKWKINDHEYLEYPGLSVLAFHDYYPGGKQGGIEIIHHGERIATNGFIRMENVDGRRFPYPERAEREIEPEGQVIRTRVSHEDFDFKYSIRIWPENESIRLSVDLEKPIPAEWEDKLSFQMEFYPPLYFGKTFHLGEVFGIVPLQANGPLVADQVGKIETPPFGQGKELTLAGEDPRRKVNIESLRGELILVDERNFSGRGWLVVKTTVPAGATGNAVEWIIRPNVIPGWKRKPVIAISQVGYHPEQIKQAIIELDPQESGFQKAGLYRVDPSDGSTMVLSRSPEKWGKFLRYDYAIFDFTEINEPGMYIVKYGDQSSNPFSINRNVYKKDVWQPTLDSYFPVQMCHVKVRDRAAIWHGACHLDDALQAPLAIEHVDGYQQYENSETSYAPLTPVPFLNQGGWHDAGDDDLAAGSQAATTHYLVFANEIFNTFYDQTAIDYDNLSVLMHRSDGIPDFVQQVKHGVLNLLSGYRAAGHSFAGIIATREGRNITGDWASQTDQLFYDSKLGAKEKTVSRSSVPDDRWAFTNRDTGLEYKVAAALSAASRTLQDYDDDLARECLETAVKAWSYEQDHEAVRMPNAYVPGNEKVEEILAAVELLYTTGDRQYATHLVGLLPDIRENMKRTAWGIARVSDQIEDENFQVEFYNVLQSYKEELDSMLSANPFGVPWEPRIWGVGWNIQQFALEHYFLVRKYPDLFDRELILRVVNYVLGCHPGSSTSLVSGVGAHSVTSAFGVYRDWWNYIPGGMVSGTALIRPDFPELKEGYPYLWQQSEYVMPGAGSYIFCVLAADDLLNN
ncbi:MAG: glycoside hydrolase family 9 protein [Cyclobacteriaceae bacterium]|nr:glycoside hydrolase family 9 protein [Cyclobacteriaceae bacterium]